MKIAISASGNTLDSQVDPRFGRCAYFILVDPDSLEFEAFPNESAMASGGAGIQAAQFVTNQGAQAVLTGNLGPNASTTLNAAGMEVFLGLSGTVRDSVQMYKQGQLQPATGPSVPDHFGMGQTTGGPKFGGSMRGGMGRGMGMGQRRMSTPSAFPTTPPSLENVETLKSQIAELKGQMEKITDKLDVLSEKGKSRRSKKKARE